MYDVEEDELVKLLNSVLGGEEEIDGLEEILPYVSGLVATRLQELEKGASSEVENILEETMVPFLDSVGVPPKLIQKAVIAIQNKIQTIASTGTTTSSMNLNQTNKLAQGVVTMSSVLQEQSNDGDDDDESMWSTGRKIKANANTQIDAYHDKVSARDKRKQRQELEKSRRDLEQQNKRQETSTKAGVSAMILPTVKGKEMDVNLQRMTLSLENGTILLEQGDLKFSYRRRYAIIGENGVGKLFDGKIKNL